MTGVLLSEEHSCGRKYRFIPWYFTGKSEESGGMMGKLIYFDFEEKTSLKLELSINEMDSL